MKSVKGTAIRSFCNQQDKSVWARVSVESFYHVCVLSEDAVWIESFLWPRELMITYLALCFPPFRSRKSFLMCDERAKWQNGRSDLFKFSLVTAHGHGCHLPQSTWQDGHAMAKKSVTRMNIYKLLILNCSDKKKMIYLYVKPFTMAFTNKLKVYTDSAGAVNISFIFTTGCAVVKCKHVVNCGNLPWIVLTVVVCFAIITHQSFLIDIRRCRNLW